MLSRAQLAALAAAAATLDERLSAAPDAPADLSALEPWAKAFASGRRETLRKRLDWEGLSEERAASALASADPFAGRELPAWTGLLQEALELAPALAGEGVPLPEMARLFPDTPPRFGDVWVPFVRAARRRLPPELPLTPEALAEFEGALLAPISFLGELVLYARFEKERRYAPLVTSLLGESLAELLLEHPALARLASLLSLGWVDAMAELGARLSADRQALRDLFGAELPVVAARPGLSDRHAGGRSIAFLTFAGGVELVYKPRSVDAEAGWNGVLAWAAGEGLRSAPPPLRMLRRDGYGYAERLHAAALEDRAQAEAYFRKAGALLAFAWFLGADDLHMENVIATADGPVVVDTESALQPERSVRDGAQSAAARAGERLYRSFARTGLLTTLALDGGGRSVDIGGLRGEGGFVTGGQRRVYLDVNSDRMRLAAEPIVAAPRENLPRLNGRRLLPDDYGEPLAEGFASAYRFLLERRGDLPLHLFDGAQTRLVFRPSELYARALFELAAPRNLTGGLSRSLLFDTLNRVFAGSDERPALWPLTGEERRALEDFDIPYFAVPVGATAIRSQSGEEVRGYLASSGLEALAERAARLSEEDLRAQLTLLRAHLYAQPHAAPGEAEAPLSRRPALPPDDLLHVAFELAAQVRALAVEGDDGGLSWITPGSLREIDRPWKGAAFSLYEGSTGVALFFAALARVSGREGPLHQARAACLPLAEALARPDAAALSAADGIGAAEGTGSVVYALALLSRLTRDAWYLDLAERAARLLTPERIAADEADDVVAGSAGAALALLALRDAGGPEDALVLAALCGERLLARGRALGPELLGWALADGRCLGGFAHGAAGNAVALARLAAALERPDLGSAALAACRYERTLYDPAQGNWPIPSKDGSPEGRQFMTAWCHGAPGIALARLAMLPSLDDPELREDLDKAVVRARATGLLTTDHCCCGNAAVVEALLTAGERLGRSELSEEARERAAVMVGRAVSRGGFLLSTTDDDTLVPGFFRGLAGIGYTLLRTARPDALPSVLAFD